MATDEFDTPTQGGQRGRTEDGLEFDQYGRYKLPEIDEDGKRIGTKLKAYTRATTFAKTLSDTYALEAWAGRMIVKGMSLRPDLIVLAASSSVDDKATLNKIAEQAKDAANVKAAANLGTAFHSLTERIDRGEVDVMVTPGVAPYLEAYQALIQAHEITMLTDLIERQVIVPRFGVAGTFDRFVEYKGETVVADVKTGRDLSYGWNEIAIQLWLYANASGMYRKESKTVIPLPKVNLTKGLVFHVPISAEKAEATLYEVNLIPAGRACELAYETRKWRQVRNLATPLTKVGMGAVPGKAHAATWTDRLNAAGSLGELSAIRMEALNLGEWTPALLALGMDRMAELKTTGVSR